MFETLERSWDITKQTFRVIRADKEILLYPVLSSILSIIFFILMVVPFLVTNLIKEAFPRQSTSAAFLIVVFLFYFGVSIIATFFNVATVFCANKRFHGGDPTFAEGIRAAISKFHLILLWSLISATVGMILRSFENSSRNRNNRQWFNLTDRRILKLVLH